MDDISIRGALAAEATCGIVRYVEETWECIDGPLAAYFEFRRKQGPDVRGEYQGWGYFGPWGRKTALLGHRSLEVLCDSFVDSIGQFVDHVNEVARNTPAGEDSQYHCLGLPFGSATHRLVWRIKPEIEWTESSQRWRLYAKLGFMPKEAWILDMEV